jgi:protein-L-isoaspartate(D-aspartate) O-methyltransferase
VTLEVEAFQAEREILVAHLSKDCGIRDVNVLDALRRTPRHLFVEESYCRQAYEDRALPIRSCQTISQPYMVARMTELAALSANDIVLEIGTGSGYQAAILACLVRQVYTVERIPELAERAGRLLNTLKFANVQIKVFDGTCGWSEYQPYSAIVVTAGAPNIPQCLVDQLDVGGRLVIPVGDEHYQRLLRLIKQKDENKIEDHGGCVFVKLIGKYGWSHGQN